ncbi:hypothetical protein PFZ49_14215 [Microbacterium lacticum]|uniref:hypothetical protein n=1 Tax=Microbacterium lacticum TaxID=33885 RepID=UPI003A89BC30
MNEQPEDQRHEARAERPEPLMAPDAERTVVDAERSAFAVHRDPSLNSGSPGSRVGRGIEWVRPSDLIAASSARFAGRGIDLHTELARQVRRAPGRTIRAGRASLRGARDRAGSRVREVPEVSEFDVFDSEYRRPSSSWVRVSGIGLR